MKYRITTTWGPNALPYNLRRNEDVEILDDQDDPRMIEYIGGVAIASTEDGGTGTNVTIEVLA